MVVLKKMYRKFFTNCLLILVGLSFFFSFSHNSNASSYGLGQYGSSFYSASVPLVTSGNIVSVSNVNVTIEANITSAGVPANIINRGTCIETTAHPRTNCLNEGGTNIGVFTQTRTGLVCGTTYYYTAYAINLTGTGYSSDKTFTTSACDTSPVITTPTVVSISFDRATIGSYVASLGIPSFISVRGTCLGTSPSPTTNCLAEGGTATGIFTQTRIGLTCGTTYYYRGYATNTTGTAYSLDGTFTTSQCISAPVINLSGGSSASSTPLVLSDSVHFGCSDPKALNYEKLVFNKQDLCKYPKAVSIIRILKYGMIGDDVKKIQEYLNTHGYILVKIGAGSPGHETTKFGPLMKKAVIRFQKDHKLKKDGIIGPKTFSLMK